MKVKVIASIKSLTNSCIDLEAAIDLIATPIHEAQPNNLFPNSTLVIIKLGEYEWVLNKKQYLIV